MAGMTADETKGILEALLEQTQSGQMRWRRGDSEFVYINSGSKLTYVAMSVDEDDRAPYRFEVWLNGEKAQKLADAETRPNWPLNVQLERMYAAAKLSSVGITSLLDEVINDIRRS